MVAYGEAYEALCVGKGGRAAAECACTSGYKESVNASDVTEMFLCVPEECQCGDGSKVDFPQLVWIFLVTQPHGPTVYLYESCHSR